MKQHPWPTRALLSKTAWYIAVLTPWRKWTLLLMYIHSRLDEINWHANWNNNDFQYGGTLALAIELFLFFLLYMAAKICLSNSLEFHFYLPMWTKICLLSLSFRKQRGILPWQFIAALQQSCSHIHVRRPKTLCLGRVLAITGLWERRPTISWASQIANYLAGSPI